MPERCGLGRHKGPVVQNALVCDEVQGGEKVNSRPLDAQEGHLPFVAAFLPLLIQ